MFITDIDGLDIHFIHVRSTNPRTLPIIITHGWPGSVIEQLKVVGPLTDPTRHGGTAADAFDVVIPSLPGYGFSAKPTATGWDPQRIARAWTTLMKRLGYTRFVAQGGDWGDAVAEQMALLAPPELLAIHTSMPATVPEDIAAALAAGAEPPADLSAEERNAYDQLAFFAPKNVTIPVAVSVFPDEIYAAPRSWTERAFPNLIYFNRQPKGGHFAAWEQPDLFIAELRAAFRSLRA